MALTDLVQSLLGWTTGLGDAALLLPASAVLFLYFALRGSLAGALGWGSALMLSAGATFLLKTGFQACGSIAPLLDIRSPSGHVSFSTTFYLSAGIAASPPGQKLRCAALLLAAALLVAAIAASRVALHAHTPAEVAVGALVGLAGVAWFAKRSAEPGAWRQLDARFILGMVVLLALLTHGLHYGVESTTTDLAAELRALLPACGDAP